MVSATGTTKVWDLADASHDRAVHRRGMDAGGPVAAVLGAVALGSAVAPGLTAEARSCLVVVAGTVAVLVGFSALRRRPALLSLVLAALGLIAPLVAGVVTMDAAMHAPAAVTSRTVPEDALAHPADALRTSAGFADLPAHQRADAQAFATGLVLRLRTLHGSWGPYPTSLRLSDDSVVEGSGLLQGTELGVVPDTSRLVYEVTPSGRAFRVAVVSTADPTAVVSADSGLAVPGAE